MTQVFRLKASIRCFSIKQLWCFCSSTPLAPSTIYHLGVNTNGDRLEVLVTARFVSAAYNKACYKSKSLIYAINDRGPNARLMSNKVKTNSFVSSHYPYLSNFRSILKFLKDGLNLIKTLKFCKLKRSRLKRNVNRSSKTQNRI